MTCPAKGSVDIQIPLTRWCHPQESNWYPGNTFITNGPALDLRVNDHEMGQTVDLRGAGHLDVEATF